MATPNDDSRPLGPPPGDSGLTRMAYIRDVLAGRAAAAAVPAASAALHPAEKALQESQRLLELFFVQSLEGFFFMMLDEPVRWDGSVDKDAVLEWVFEHQRVTRVNDAMVEQYGARVEDLLGRTPAEAFAHDPEKGRALWRQLFDAGRLHLEIDERKLDGTAMWVEADYICLYAPDGRIMGHFGVQRDVTARRVAEEESARSREELRALAARLESVREEERTRIAREIHDELGQSLTGLKLDIAWLRQRLREQTDLVDRVQSVVGRIDGTIDAVRRIATELRPSVLDHLGLVAAVEWQAREFEQLSGLVVALRLPPDNAAIQPDIATTVFRMLQETLTNVARHAEATRVDIGLEVDDAAVTLRVEDNGRGITDAEVRNRRSLGLVGLRERAIACGGELTLEGRRGLGTIVTARLPLRPVAERRP